MDDDAITRALLVASLRGMNWSTAGTPRPPLLLLCAAPGERAPPQIGFGVPVLVPAMSPSSVATMRPFLSNLPLMVGVDVVTGELVVRMRDSSLDTPFSTMTTGALGCGG